MASSTRPKGRATTRPVEAAEAGPEHQQRDDSRNRVGGTYRERDTAHAYGPDENDGERRC